MPKTMPMTIEVRPETKAKLDRLARESRRSGASLAAAAVEAFVDQEIALAEGIAQGLADLSAGRIVAHAEAMEEVSSAIGAASIRS